MLFPLQPVRGKSNMLFYITASQEIMQYVVFHYSQSGDNAICPSCQAEDCVVEDSNLKQVREGVIFMADRRKSPKKVAENRKKGKNSAENRKKKCVGNRKMTFLSHGKPEKLNISAEKGKLFLKTAETGKLF